MIVLFLCTGNHYRSRFAEIYFRHLAHREGLDWEVDSAGLALSPANPGPISDFTVRECRRLGIDPGPTRWPRDLKEEDLEGATLTVAVKEQEHRPLLGQRFPGWEERVEYWNVHDLDGAPAAEALAQLRENVEQLFGRLRAGAGSAPPPAPIRDDDQPPW